MATTPKDVKEVKDKKDDREEKHKGDASSTRRTSLIGKDNPPNFKLPSAAFDPNTQKTLLGFDPDRYDMSAFYMQALEVNEGSWAGCQHELDQTKDLFQRDNNNVQVFYRRFVRTVLENYQDCEKVVNNYSLASITVRGLFTAGIGASAQNAAAGAIGTLASLYQMQNMSDETHRKTLAALFLEIGKTYDQAKEFAQRMATFLWQSYCGLISELTTVSVQSLADFFAMSLIEYLGVQQGDVNSLRHSCENLIPNADSKLYNKEGLSFKKKTLTSTLVKNKKLTIMGALIRPPVCLPDGSCYVRQKSGDDKKPINRAEKYNFRICYTNAGCLDAGYELVFPADPNRTTPSNLTTIKSELMTDLLKDLYGASPKIDDVREDMKSCLGMLEGKDLKTSSDILYRYAIGETANLVQTYCEMQSSTFKLKTRISMREGDNFEILAAKINILAQNQRALINRLETTKTQERKAKEDEVITQQLEKVGACIQILRKIYLEVLNKKHEKRQAVLKLKEDDRRKWGRKQDERSFFGKMWDGTQYLGWTTFEVLIRDTAFEFRDLASAIIHPSNTFSRVKVVGKYIWQQPDRVIKDLWRTGTEHLRDDPLRCILQGGKLYFLWGGSLESLLPSLLPKVVKSTILNTSNNLASTVANTAAMVAPPMLTQYGLETIKYTSAVIPVVNTTVTHAEKAVNVANKRLHLKTD